MKKLRSLMVYAIVISSFFGLSCKKEKDQAAILSNCRIITALGGPDTYHFTYNADGRPSSLLVAPGKQKLTYTYNGNITTILDEVNGIFKAKLIVTNNSFGFAINIRREANKTGTVWNNQSIEYNGTQIAKILYTTSDPNQGVMAVNYTWKNGNLATMEAGGTMITFEYYTDKLSAPGEWRRYAELTDGFRLYDNKNLTKSMKNGTDITNFKYEFDSDGKIIKATVIEPGNAESFVEFEHACN